MSATSSLAAARVLPAHPARGVRGRRWRCSRPGARRPRPKSRAPVTDKQADELAAQVAVQEALVAAYAAAGAADPAVKAAVVRARPTGRRAAERLCRRPPRRSGRRRRPRRAPRRRADDARAWLRGQVAATATSHATACLDQSGAAGGAARIDRRGPARPGREAGMTRDG